MKIDDIHASLSLEGKVALVTGASSGLGEHFAHVLAAAGASVVVAARRKERLDKLVSEIVDAGGRACAVELDVTNSQQVADAVIAAEEAFGIVDILVNNAGVANTARFVDEEEEDWDFVINTNLKGAWAVAHQVAKRLVEAGKPGSIINIASILGLRVGSGVAAYAVSKAGVVQMTRAMALDLVSKGIRTNAICPGYFLTEINADYFATERGRKFLDATPAGRCGQYDELTMPLLMLASDAGSFINGVALPVDGGHLVSSL